jgi:hypothetical protein
MVQSVMAKTWDEAEAAHKHCLANLNLDGTSNSRNNEKRSIEARVQQIQNALQEIYGVMKAARTSPHI